MSARTSITQALVAKLKLINGEAPYTSNIFNNCFPKNKFWDECSDFPTVFVVAGQEQREYKPGGFKWGFLNISLKVYVKQEDPQEALEALLDDLEKVIDNNIVLTYGEGPGQQTADIMIEDIVTDEGLLVPYGIGEVNIRVQYQVL